MVESQGGRKEAEKVEARERGRQEGKGTTQNTYFRQDGNQGMIQDESPSPPLRGTLRSGPSPRPWPSLGADSGASHPPQTHPWLVPTPLCRPGPTQGKPSEGDPATPPPWRSSAQGLGLDTQFVGQGGLRKALRIAPWDRIGHPRRQLHGIGRGREQHIGGPRGLVARGHG